MTLSRPQITALSTLVILPLCLSCESTAKQPDVPAVAVMDHAGLLAVSPADIVIAPVQDLSAGAVAPAADLRRAFQRGLVSRRYSPLALEYVDAQLVNAAFVAGSLCEEAILEIRVMSWDMSLWDLHSAISVAVEARLMDSADPGGAPLWGARFAKRINLSSERHSSPTQALVMGRAADMVAADLLAVLPARNPSPGDIRR